MDYGSLTSCFTRQRSRAGDSNFFGIVRPLESKVAHARVTGGQVARLQMLEDLVIFSVNQCHGAQPGNLAHCLQQKTEVRVEAECSVRQEELEGSHAERNNRL